VLPARKGGLARQESFENKTLVANPATVSGLFEGIRGSAEIIVKASRKIEVNRVLKKLVKKP
jgi:hypothetical protein